MELDIYKNLLFQNIKAQISRWIEPEDRMPIDNKEVYRFLHSIKGNSGILLLGGLYQLSELLLNQINEKDDKQWKKEELRNFLDELIRLSNEYENFAEMEGNKEQPRDESSPLIQIIDEDVSMLILLKDTLEEKGWKVIANTTPEKAISQYMDLNPDCVVMDVNLASINRFQMMNDLENHNSQRFVPKIVISLLNDRMTRINAYKMGADDFIKKPIDLEEFTIRIERHLKRKKIYADHAQFQAKENGRARIEIINQPLTEIEKNPLYVSIIDDDAIIREMLMKVLKKMDLDRFELNLEAFNGGVVFFESKRLEKKGEHFLILDGVMPVMDGIEILQRVKKINSGANIHVLMLTGRKSESDIARALKLGADDYMTKPFSIKELQARIQRLIQRM